MTQEYHDTKHDASRRGSTLRSALGYARKGIPVFPLNVNEPLTAHGFKDATTDPRQIHMWWNRYPEANIGIPTGGVSGLADALRRFLRRNPHRRDEKPGWFAVALWSDGCVQTKPTPLAVEVALEELRRGAA